MLKRKLIFIETICLMVIIVFGGVALSGDEVDQLIDTLKNGSPYFKYEAARKLGEIRDVRAVEPLIAALQDETPDVRLHAAEALGNIGEKRAIEALKQLLNRETGTRIEIYVADALQKLTGEDYGATAIRSKREEAAKAKKEMEEYAKEIKERKYVMTISSDKVRADERYSLSNVGSSDGIVRRPGEYGHYWVSSGKMKILDTSQETIHIDIDQRGKAGGPIKLSWAPNPISSSGVLMYELFHCNTECNPADQTLLSGDLFAGIIVGPQQSPIVFNDAFRGFQEIKGTYAIRLLDLDTGKQLSRWISFRVQ